MKKKNKKQQQEEIKETNENSKQNFNFDFLFALRTEPHETKPNMSKLLKKYVTSIRISTQQKIQLYPKIHYDIGLCIIDLKNGDSIIKNYFKDNQENKFLYYYQVGIDIIELKEKDQKNIERLFNRLEEFKFIRNGNEDVKVFSTDVTKINDQIQQEIDCSAS